MKTWTQKQFDDATQHLKFVVPPAKQGQMIERSYATNGDVIFVRSVDRSLKHETSRIYDLPGAGVDAFDPANEEPFLGDLIGEVDAIDPGAQCSDHGCARHRCDADHA